MAKNMGFIRNPRVLAAVLILLILSVTGIGWFVADKINRISYSGDRI